jgi:hypothetical protein
MRFNVKDFYATALVAAILTIYIVLGALALIAVLVGLVSGDSAALATLVVVTVALWVTATVRHLLTSPDGQHRSDALGQRPWRAVRH